MNYINPYNFVPLEKEPDRSIHYPGLHRFIENSYSGKLICVLTAETALISLGDFKTITVSIDQKDGSKKQKDIKQYSFSKNNNNHPMLRATSIKGMIRAIYECIEPSCIPLLTLRGEYDQPVKKIPGVRTPTLTFEYEEIGAFSHEKCSDHDNLCPSCRLFGSVAGGDKGFKGRIAFSDALLCKESTVKNRENQKLVMGCFYLPILDKPKPHHYATYANSVCVGKASIAGRKFYYHHSKSKKWTVEEQEAIKRNHVYAIKEYAPIGVQFTFEILCENLTEREITALVTALELEEGMGHKIGLGKAVGLGSCTIKIDWERSTINNSQLRYGKKGKEQPIKEVIDGCKSKIELSDELREVLRIDKETPTAVIGYPSRDDYKSAPFNKPIDALGVFNGRTTTVQGVYTAEDGATEGPSTPAPKVGKSEVAAWLKEIYKDRLVFVHSDGRTETRPRNACQKVKKEQLVPGRWFILFGEKASKPAT